MQQEEGPNKREREKGPKGAPSPKSPQTPPVDPSLQRARVRSQGSDPDLQPGPSEPPNQRRGVREGREIPPRGKGRGELPADKGTRRGAAGRGAARRLPGTRVRWPRSPRSEAGPRAGGRGVGDVRRAPTLHRGASPPPRPVKAAPGKARGPWGRTPGRPRTGRRHAAPGRRTASLPRGRKLGRGHLRAASARPMCLPARPRRETSADRPGQPRPRAAPIGCAAVAGRTPRRAEERARSVHSARGQSESRAEREQPMGGLPARGALSFFSPLPFPPVREARLRAGMWGRWPARAPGERALPGGEARDEAAVGRRLLARRRAGLEGRRREEAPGLQRTRLGTGEACTVPAGGVPAPLPALGASRPRLLVLSPRANLLAFGGRDPQNGKPVGRGCRPRPRTGSPLGSPLPGRSARTCRSGTARPIQSGAGPPAPPPQGDGPQTTPLTGDLRSGPRSACNFLPGGAQSLVCSSVQGGGWSWCKKEK